ncbi:MAG: ATP-grasp domain-containing protein [Eubacteriales bacterium]|nr:ATP-grasp domain-containing protein [Eubacteriales bacterium]
MKVVLYFTNAIATGSFQGETRILNIPSRLEQFRRVLDKYPEHEFVIVGCRTATAITDPTTYEYTDPDGRLKYVYLDPSASAERYVEVILKETPAIAVAMSNTSSGVDWNTLRDSIIANALNEKGIRTIAHSFAARIFMSKSQTHDVLKALGFLVADGFSVSMSLYNVEKNNPMIASNVYKDGVRYALMKLRYPVLIKDSTGSNSEGIFIVHSPEEAVQKLDSIEGAGNLYTIEEMIQGEQFGTEIHGVRGNYVVVPPFRLSTNAEGISVGSSNCKIGPVTDEKYNIPALQEMLLRLAYTTGLEGTAEIDLVFSEDKWWIIEVNPRSSGLSNLASASQMKYPAESVVDPVLDTKHKMSDVQFTKCIQLPIGEVTDEQLEELKQLPHFWTAFIYSNPYIHFGNLVLNGFESEAEILDYVRELNGRLPEVITEDIVKLVERTIQAV